MNKILLDTNAYSVLFKTKDNEVLQAIETADKIFISVVVMGELLYGFKKGKKEIENKQVLQRFLEKPTVEIYPSHLRMLRA